MGANRRCLAIPLALAIVLPLIPSDSDAAGDANFFFGRKKLGSNIFDLSHQGEFGAQVSFGHEMWPVMIAVDLLVTGNAHEMKVSPTYSGSETIDYPLDIGVATAELGVGVRKIWTYHATSIRPYFGGGVGLVSAAARIEDDHTGDTLAHDSDVVVAPWADAGAFWRLGKSFNLGLGVRYSKAKVQLEDVGFTRKLQVGGVHFIALMGWGW